MLRAQKGSVHRLYLSAYSAGAAPSATASGPTLTVTRASTGATVLSAVAASPDSSETGTFFYDLPSATATVSVDTLTCTWSFTTPDGNAQTVTDVVDVVSQRLASLRTVDDSLNRGGTSTAYPARKLQAALAYAEDVFEQAADVQWGVRYAAVTLDGPGASDLFLPHYPVQSVLSAAQNGVALTAGELADLSIYSGVGQVYSPVLWQSGRANITVAYTHGETVVPAGVSRAVTLIATSVLADAPFDDRGFGVTTDGGFVRLLTAGVSGAAFSIPEVQAALATYGRKPAERLLGTRVG